MPKMIRLPPLLKPHLTWQYIVCASIGVYISYCVLFDSPLFASRLPQYTGPYNVGAIDIEAPCEDRWISNFRSKSTGEPAFQLSTVLFTVYYPATNKHSRPRHRHYWIPKPISITGEGYLRFGSVNNFISNSIITGALWGVAGGITIPGKVDVPLADAEEAKLLTSQADYTIQMIPQQKDQLPVLVFSHGFASSRTDYTNYLGELASRGYVVAAIEHRDGSGPGSLVMKDGKPTKVAFPIKFSHMEETSDLDAADFKQAQLDFRQAEVEETIRVLKAVNNGQGDHIYRSNSRNEGKDLQQWRGRLNMKEVTIGGHSFGATLALQTLKNAPSEALPLAGGVALDPGKSSGQLNTDINVPLLVIHSNSWSKQHSVFFGRPHFDVVKELVEGVDGRGKAAWFLTSRKFVLFVLQNIGLMVSSGHLSPKRN
jgi:platelet-activating factor acetylhydrolase